MHIAWLGAYILNRRTLARKRGDKIYKWRSNSQTLGTQLRRGNLLIVDGLNIAFRWKHQGVLDFKYDYMLRTVESLAKSYNAGNDSNVC